MKKFTTKSFLLLITACIFTVSCKKEDKPAADNTISLLQNKNWKLTAASEKSVYGTVNVYNDYLEDCNRDDLYMFKTGNVFMLDEGPSKCNPADDQTQSGTWSYTEGTKILHFTLNTPSDDFDLTILSINETTFSGKSVEIDAGVTYTTTFTFAKQ